MLLISLQIEVIKNNATEILQEARAISDAIMIVARAERNAALDRARTQGLMLMFNRLNMTEQEAKNRVDYLQNLIGHEKAHFTVDFDMKIAGNL